MLFEFFLRHRSDLHIRVKDDRPCRGGALVDCEDMGHEFHLLEQAHTRV